MAYKQSGWTAFTKKDDYIPQSKRPKIETEQYYAADKKGNIAKIQPNDYEPQSQRGDWEDHKGKKEKIQWEDHRPQSKGPINPEGPREIKPFRSRPPYKFPKKYMDTGTTIGEGLPSDTMKNVQKRYGKERLEKAKNFEYTPQTTKSKWGSGKGEELKPATTVDRDQHPSWFGKDYSQRTPQTQDDTRQYSSYSPQSVIKKKTSSWFSPRIPMEVKIKPMIPKITPKKKKKYVPQTQRKN